MNANVPGGAAAVPTNATNMIFIPLNTPLEVKTSAVNLTISSALATYETIIVTLFGFHEQK